MRPPVFDRVALTRHKGADWAAPAVGALAVGEWECGFSDRYRLAEVYIGYTCDHLPACVRIPLPSREVAIPASFAARMAFSSFTMRAPVRYGRSASSSVR